jgi:hypothetical protein
LHCADYEPAGLILLVSPSLRQSRELFAKVTDFLRALEPAPALDEDNKLSCMLGNGSRIVSLPGDPKTIRGFSAPALVIEDEAAYVDDELDGAIRPMLAVSRGRLVLLSTPNGRRGHFCEIWHSGEGWRRIAIAGRDCPRITVEFLDAERKALGPMVFEQEYCGQFVDAASSAFSSELVELALVDDFEPFAPAALATPRFSAAGTSNGFRSGRRMSGLCTTSRGYCTGYRPEASWRSTIRVSGGRSPTCSLRPGFRRRWC